MKNLRFLAVLVTVILLSNKTFAQVASNDEFSGSYKMQENPYVKVLKVNVKDLSIWTQLISILNLVFSAHISPFFR
mgnify:CR=1 FL=1